MAAYEYLFVVTVSSTGWPEGKQVFKDDLAIYRPHTAEVERRAMGQAGIFELANELGAEGWRLVSESIPAARIADHMHGWGGVSSPVQTRWTFERIITP